MCHMEQDSLQGEIKNININLLLELSKCLEVLCLSEATQTKDRCKEPIQSKNKCQNKIKCRAGRKSELVGFKELTETNFEYFQMIILEDQPSANFSLTKIRYCIARIHI